MEISISNDDGYPRLVCEVGPSQLQQAASALAAAVARRRIGVNPRLHALWVKHNSGEAEGPLDEKDLKLLQAALLENIGTPDDPADAGHLNGLIAEAVWLVIEAIDAGLGAPLRVESLGLEVLNGIFDQGRPPEPPLDGRTRGELISLELGPLLTPAMSWLTGVWLPWKGKMFDAGRARGDNIFTSDSRPVARIFNPGYRNYVDDGPGRFRALTFHTYTGPGIEDKDRTVLKLDYDLPENPRLTVRRVLDELVQIEPGHCLGKAHLRAPSGRWRRVGFSH